MSAGVTLYHYPGCSTCKKARAFLAKKGVEVRAIDLVEEPPSAKVLADVLALSGLELKKLFNVSGQSYRQGGFKEKLPGMSEKQALAALAADGKLIKRPILRMGDVALVGFDEEAWTAALRRVS
jgi:arsenate reductase (glutaredoxin)